MLAQVNQLIGQLFGGGRIASCADFSTGVCFHSSNSRFPPAAGGRFVDQWSDLCRYRLLIIRLLILKLMQRPPNPAAQQEICFTFLGSNRFLESHLILPLELTG